MPQSICILGGTGFVGRHLAARLANDGHGLTILTRNRARNRGLLVLPTARVWQENIHQVEVLERHFQGCDTVINLVGILNEKGRDGKGFRHVQVDLVRKVLEACRKTGVRRLLHVSALRADAETGPSHYLRSKGQAEDLIRESTDLNYTIFRPSIIFGPDDSSTNRFAWILRWLPILPLARPNARSAPVYVYDVVDALTTTLEDPKAYQRTYQLCGPQVYSLRELVKLVAVTLGLKRWVIGLPDSLSRLQAAVLDFWPGKPFSTDNYRSLSVHSLCEEDGFAALGLSPQSLEIILAQYLVDEGKQRKLSLFRQEAGR